MARDLVPHLLSTAIAGSLCLGLPACVEQTPEGPTEEDVKAAKEHILQAAPTPKFSVNAVLVPPAGQGKGKITYLGMDVDQAQVSPGQPFTVTHYFRCDEPVSEGWRTFVHLGGEGDKRSHLNADHVPVGGKYPVSMWKKGEIIRDVHKVALPPSWVGDKLTVYTGLWKGQLRYKVESGAHDNENRVIAAAIPVSGGAAPAPAPSTKRLVARKLKPGAAITIDGKLDEAAWADAQRTGPFVHTMSGGPADQPAEARVLWDDKSLYVAFEFADKDIWGSLDKHDDKLWTQEAAELFIDADGDGKTYIELQVSPKNVTFDSWLPAYRQNDNAWDAPVKTAVVVSGTLDKRDDTDKGWTVEMQIPMEAVKGRLAEVKGVPPTPGTEWRVNFFRMDIPGGKPQVASGWSPPMVGDFHALDKFGTLAFGDAEGSVPMKVNALVAPPQAPHPVSPMIKRLMMVNKERAEGGISVDPKAQAAAKDAPAPDAKDDKAKAEPEGKKGKAKPKKQP